MNKARFVFLAGFVFSGAWLSGCNYHDPTDIMAFYKPQQVFVTAEDYIILPPDEIVVYCSNVPEIHEQRETVRPDGKVSFEVVGEIEIAGKTPSQAAELIRERVSGLYNLAGDFPVEVRVFENRSKYYYVVGEVKNPGPQPCSGRDSLVHAVNLAVPEVTAWKQRIRVIRPAEEEGAKPEVFEYNLMRLLKQGDGRQNVLLQPGDVVYVQPTILAAIGKVVAELVYPIAQAASPALTVQRISVGAPQ